MEYSNEENISPWEHITTIFREFTTPSRVLQSFTNLSNTVIQTALSGQSKFVFEILQNADDAFEDEHKAIEVQFILQDNYLIVHHNGKGFDFNDVERICDYASQIEKVKANDLSKTGYKGLGFKSLFNLSDCIYIYSNGYSFRFDKTHWPDSQSKPWQVIPIWCRLDELPLSEKYPYDQPVNFILQVNDISQIESQLKELVDQPELLLYLHRINKLGITLNGQKHSLVRKVENLDIFNKVDFYKNQLLASTWLSRTYKLSVPTEVQTFVQGASRFIYPNKIQKAKEATFTFALQCDETLKEISKIKGLCYSTLPTQLHLALPYHINSLFILNLDRTQLHENEWNVFLIHEIGRLQLIFLKDLAGMTYLKNYVIELLVREIDHPYATFSKAFLKGFTEGKSEIGWLPAHQGSRLLKLGEAWTDKTNFFKQNFQNIRDHKIYPYLINSDVRSQYCLSFSEGEVKHFTYVQLFRDFPNKYYPQLTKNSYINFITYLYERLKGFSANTKDMVKLKNVPFLTAKDGTLQTPKNALLEESENPIPDFLKLTLIDNEYLPVDNISLIKDWLVLLGARRLLTSIEVLRESILKWVDSGNFEIKITMKNHIGIINYLAKNAEHLTRRETEKLKEQLIILTEGNKFEQARLCYLPDAVSIKELADVISNDEKISSCYDMDFLRGFFIHIGVHDKLNPIDVFRKSILMWIKNGEINYKLTKGNYNSIIEFVASHYPTIERNLTTSEKGELKKIPVLTCGELFQRAEVCYFDSAILTIRGFEYIIAKDKLVSTKNTSENVINFLKKIGVSKKIAPVDVIRKSILRWIQGGDIKNRIIVDNHHDILNYIADKWVILNRSSYGLKPKEKQDLKQIPILTEGGTFRAVCSCYWPNSNSNDNNHEEIPGLKSIISSDEYASSVYQSKEIKRLLEDLGVRILSFTNIYEKYSNHLTQHENLKWFFSRLIHYWKKSNTSSNNDKLLTYLQQKFKSSSRLLAKNGKMYYSAELYSSRFDTIHNIDPNSIPLLDCEKLPEDLETYLGFKTDMDLKCIMQLFKAIHKKPVLGEKETRSFFTILLEQLRRKDKNEIKKHQLSLFSKDNKLRAARDLYYFIEEDSNCVLDSCYLKRIHSMSHNETLELAELCGVNTLPFEQKINREKEIYDDTLKEFYLKRLPLIVIQESRELNESPSITLKRLYDEICTIKLYQCQHIYVQYPFGNSTEIEKHFDNLTLYVIGKWTSWEHKSEIHSHIKKKLGLRTNIAKIVDMEPITEENKQAWLRYKREDQQNFYLIEEELQQLLPKQENVFVSCENAKVSEQPHIFKDEEKHFIGNEFSENEKLTSSESSSNESSEESIDEPCSENLYTIRDEPKIITSYKTINDSLNKDITEVGTKSLIPNESDIGHKKRINEPGILGSHYSSTESLHIESYGWHQVITDKKPHIKRLSEKYVFNFLQDHYKKKYPNAQFNLLGGLFKLQLQSYKIEIVWLNESEDKGHPYDLLLNKDGEIKQLIKVKSSNDVANNDSFDTSHQKFTKKMNQLATELPQHKEKYCIYRVFSTENPLVTSVEGLNSPSLYKIVLLESSIFDGKIM